MVGYGSRVRSVIAGAFAAAGNLPGATDDAAGRLDRLAALILALELPELP